MPQTLKNSDANIKIPADLPFLRAICWQTEDISCFSLSEMLDCYERGWKYRGVLSDLEGEESDFVYDLAKKADSWIAGDV